MTNTTDKLAAALRAIDDLTRIDSDTKELALRALSNIRDELREALAEYDAQQVAERMLAVREHVLRLSQELDDRGRYNDADVLKELVTNLAPAVAEQAAERIDVLAVMAAAAACLHDSGMPLTAADLRQARAAVVELVVKAVNLRHYLDGYLHWQAEQGNDPVRLEIATNDIAEFRAALARVQGEKP